MTFSVTCESITFSYESNLFVIYLQRDGKGLIMKAFSFLQNLPAHPFVVYSIPQV